MKTSLLSRAFVPPPRLTGPTSSSSCPTITHRRPSARISFRKLGEHSLWGKAANFETSARVPLIVSAPGRKGNGRQASGLVEFVDVHPTLRELAGLPLPTHLEGVSAVPLLNDPARTWKTAVFTQSPCPALREWAGLPLDQHMSQTFRPLMGKIEKQIQAMDPDDFSLEKYNQHVTGYSMRTDRHRFVCWRDDRQPGKPVAVELYDHQNDPDENVNIAVDQANADLLKQLTQQWRDGWRKALPTGKLN